MAARYPIDPARLTPVLTSCGRFDLLEETVASFLAHFAPERLVIAEDSLNAAGADDFARRFPVADMRVNASKLGQMRSIDALYATLATPYVLHLEDDWRFDAGVDLGRVMSFMEARPDISVVCVGYRFDRRYRRTARKTEHAGIEYLVWDLDAHPMWFSYSFNPSVGRVALWREIGPFARFGTEEAISQFCKARGMRIAMAVPSIATHIGGERHAHDPYQPVRSKSPLHKLKRSLVKRWAQLQGRRAG
jgi:hypothetical protein